MNSIKKQGFPAVLLKQTLDKPRVRSSSSNGHHSLNHLIHAANVAIPDFNIRDVEIEHDVLVSLQGLNRFEEQTLVVHFIRSVAPNNHQRIWILQVRNQEIDHIQR
eukprot:scaffold20461_cov117-Cylindrotheca_fusiformis.AAC.7